MPSPSRFSIRNRILVFQLIVALAVLALFAAALVTARNFAYYLARGELAHDQLAAVTQLASDAERYSERIGELLVTGSADHAAIAELQGRIGADFGALARSTERERRFLAGSSEPQHPSEIDRVTRLHQIYAELNTRIEALLAMQAGGAQDAAMRVFYREIGAGLDDAFERLVADAISNEMAEIEVADAEANRVADRLAWLIGLTSAAVLAITALAGYRLYRAMADPIRRLSAGADAIGRGDLSSRIGPLGPGEFGRLAERFDDMAAQLEAQNRQIMTAQAGLEADITARTAELEVANAALRDLDRSRLRFLADVSHELRTPLTILRGEAEVALRDRTGSLEAQRETLRRMLSQARDMARLVDDLLLLARSEAEDIRFHPEPLDLAMLAQEAAREGRLLGRARGVRIHAEIDSPGPQIEADPLRLKQVALILLDNAVRYSPAEAAVLLRVVKTTDAAALVVRNRSAASGSGAGNFPLQAEAGSVLRNASGSGLGLTIAKRMVEQQGGSIAVESRSGDFQVSVRFPALAVAPARTAARLSA